MKDRLTTTDMDGGATTRIKTTWREHDSATTLNTVGPHSALQHGFWCYCFLPISRIKTEHRARRHPQPSLLCTDPLESVSVDTQLSPAASPFLLHCSESRLAWVCAVCGCSGSNHYCPCCLSKKRHCLCRLAFSTATSTRFYHIP